MQFDGAEDPAAESGAVSAKMSDVGDADGYTSDDSIGSIFAEHRKRRARQLASEVKGANPKRRKIHAEVASSSPVGSSSAKNSPPTHKTPKASPSSPAPSLERGKPSKISPRTRPSSNVVSSTSSSPSPSPSPSRTTTTTTTRTTETTKRVKRYLAEPATRRTRFSADDSRIIAEYVAEAFRVCANTGICKLEVRRKDQKANLKRLRIFSETSPDRFLLDWEGVNQQKLATEAFFNALCPSESHVAASSNNAVLDVLNISAEDLKQEINIILQSHRRCEYVDQLRTYKNSDGPRGSVLTFTVRNKNANAQLAEPALKGSSRTTPSAGKSPLVVSRGREKVTMRSELGKRPHREAQTSAKSCTSAQSSPSRSNTNASGTDKSLVSLATLQKELKKTAKANKDLLDAVNGMNTERERMSDELNGKGEEINRLREQLRREKAARDSKESIAERKSSQKALEDIKEQLEVNKARAAAAETTLALAQRAQTETDTNLQNARGEIELLNAKLTKTSQECQQEANKAKGREKEVFHLSKELENAKTKLSDKQTDYERVLREYETLHDENASLKQMEVQAQKTSKKLEQLSKQREVSERQRENMESANAKLNARLRQTSEEANKLKEQCKLLDKRLFGSKSRYCQLRDELDQAKRLASEKADEATRLETTLTNLLQTNFGLESERDQLKRERDQLAANIHQMRENLSDEIAKLAKLGEQNATLEQTCTKLRHEKSELAEQHDELLNKKELLTSQFHNAEDEIGRLKRDLSNIKMESGRQSEDLVKKEDELNSLKKDNEMLRAELLAEQQQQKDIKERERSRTTLERVWKADMKNVTDLKRQLEDEKKKTKRLSAKVASLQGENDAIRPQPAPAKRRKLSGPGPRSARSIEVPASLMMQRSLKEPQMRKLESSPFI